MNEKREGEKKMKFQLHCIPCLSYIFMCVFLLLSFLCFAKSEKTHLNDFLCCILNWSMRRTRNSKIYTRNHYASFFFIFLCQCVNFYTYINIYTNEWEDTRMLWKCFKFLSYHLIYSFISVGFFVDVCVWIHSILFIFPLNATAMKFSFHFDFLIFLRCNLLPIQSFTAQFLS